MRKIEPPPERLPREREDDDEAEERLRLDLAEEDDPAEDDEADERRVPFDDEADDGVRLGVTGKAEDDLPPEPVVITGGFLVLPPLAAMVCLYPSRAGS